MAHLIVVGVLCALVVSLFTRQIVRQLRSGKVRPRGSTVYKTRQNDPVWYWSSIVVQVVVVLLALYFFSVTALKASR